MKRYLILLSFASTILSFGACKKSNCSPTACKQIPDTGLCEAAFERYYFNQKEQKCKVFIWGGCGGSVPFETLKECEACKCAE